jgi:hypothetical protein
LIENPGIFRELKLDLAKAVMLALIDRGQADLLRPLLGLKSAGHRKASLLAELLLEHAVQSQKRQNCLPKKKAILNNGYIGFGFVSMPLSEVDVTVTQRLNAFLTFDYPEGSFIQIMLLASPDIRVRMEAMLNMRDVEGSKSLKKSAENRLGLFVAATVQGVGDADLFREIGWTMKEDAYYGLIVLDGKSVISAPEEAYADVNR